MLQESVHESLQKLELLYLKSSKEANDSFAFASGKCSRKEQLNSELLSIKRETDDIDTEIIELKAKKKETVLEMLHLQSARQTECQLCSNFQSEIKQFLLEILQDTIKTNNGMYETNRKKQNVYTDKIQQIIEDPNRTSTQILQLLLNTFTSIKTEINEVEKYLMALKPTQPLTPGIFPNLRRLFNDTSFNKLNFLQSWWYANVLKEE